MILLALLAATTAPPTSPQAFMQRLYAQYRNADFSPFTHIDRVFAPHLIAAIKEDERLAHGEVGYLDGDPVCQCQDPAGMHPTGRRGDAARPQCCNYFSEMSAEPVVE